MFWVVYLLATMRAKGLKWQAGTRVAKGKGFLSASVGFFVTSSFS